MFTLRTAADMSRGTFMSTEKRNLAYQRAAKWFSSPTEVGSWIERLRQLQTKLGTGQAEYTEPMPPLLSHVESYAKDDESLRR
jgi:hypothetical protein